MSVRQFSEHIRALRDLYGFTQEQLAERAEISRSYIAKIESEGRNVNWKTLEKISFAFGMTLPEFLTSTNAFEVAEYEEVHDDKSITYRIIEFEKLPTAKEQEKL